MLFNTIRAITIAVLLGIPATAGQAKLVRPIKVLFSHPSHRKVFQGSGVSCVDCHSFSVKAKSRDPLGEPVAKGFLEVPRERCHQCHLGKVSTPTPNQCVLCHKDVAQLQPENHFHNWTQRHGKISQMDPNSCTACHTKSSCSECHLHKNVQRIKAHPPNFRFTHSVQAPANPSSCVSCHSGQNSCIQCHFKGNL